MALNTVQWSSGLRSAAELSAGAAGLAVCSAGCKLPQGHGLAQLTRVHGPVQMGSRPVLCIMIFKTKPVRAGRPVRLCNVLTTRPAMHPFPSPVKSPRISEQHCLPSGCTAPGAPRRSWQRLRLAPGSGQSSLRVKVTAAGGCDGVSTAFGSRFPSLP